MGAGSAWVHRRPRRPWGPMPAGMLLRRRPPPVERASRGRPGAQGGARLGIEEVEPGGVDGQLHGVARSQAAPGAEAGDEATAPTDHVGPHGVGRRVARDLTSEDVHGDGVDQRRTPVTPDTPTADDAVAPGVRAGIPLAPGPGRGELDLVAGAVA